MKYQNLVAFLSVLLASPAFAANVPFGPEQTITAIDGASDVIAGDLNDDGAPDVFGLAEASDQLRSALNNGDGSSWDLDVVVANRVSDAYFWQENLNGDASSWAQRIIGTGHDQAQVVWAGDLDGDGDTDVVGAAGSTAGLAWFENTDGAGTAWTAQTLQIGGTSGSSASRPQTSTATATSTSSSTTPTTAHHRRPPSWNGGRTPPVTARPGRSTSSVPSSNLR